MSKRATSGVSPSLCTGRSTTGPPPVVDQTDPATERAWMLGFGSFSHLSLGRNVNRSPLAPRSVIGTAPARSTVDFPVAVRPCTTVACGSSRSARYSIRAMFPMVSSTSRHACPSGAAALAVRASAVVIASFLLQRSALLLFAGTTSTSCGFRERRLDLRGSAVQQQQELLGADRLEAAGATLKDTWTLSDVGVAWHGEIADREPSVYDAIEAAGIVHGKAIRS